MDSDAPVYIQDVDSSKAANETLDPNTMFRLLSVSLGINLATLVHIFVFIVTSLPAVTKCFHERVVEKEGSKKEQKRRVYRWKEIPEK